MNAAATRAGDGHVVFVMGAFHGGTTLFDLILGTHRRGFSLGEIRKAGKKLKRLRNQSLICSICDGPCPFWGDAVAPDLIRRWIGGHGQKQPDGPRPGPFPTLYHELAAGSGASVLIDSSKDLPWYRRHSDRLADSRSMRPFYLLVTRDGRASTNSMLRKYGPAEFEARLHAWARRAEDLRAGYDTADPARRLRTSYEALCADPEGTMRVIFDRIGLDPDPASLAYWNGDHHLIGGNAGTRSLIQRRQAEQAGRTYQVSLRADRADHYRAHGYGITEDRRWVDEMPAAQRALFDRIAGETNRRNGYDDAA